MTTLAAGVFCIMMPRDASAVEALGAIGGKVTIAGTGVPIVADRVCVTELAASGFGPDEIGPACTVTNAAGEYTLSRLPSGEYKLFFDNDAMCSVKEYALTYASQYYDNKSSLAEASPVRVIAFATTIEINASIVATATEAWEKPGIEYRCNQTFAKPTSEGTGTMPGAIEPLPVNKQIEEEFWANPPWKQKATQESPTAAARLAVVAPTASVKGGSAMVRVDCTSVNACAGTLRLVKSMTEKRTPRRHDKRLAVKHKHSVVLGAARYSLAMDSSKVLRVRLTTKGQALFGKASKNGLAVTLTGSGIQRGTLVLR